MTNELDALRSELTSCRNYAALLHDELDHIGELIERAHETGTPEDMQALRDYHKKVVGYTKTTKR
jgi:hypothetical protein